MTPAFYLSYAVLWALVVFLTLVVLGLVRSNYRLQQEGGAGGGSMRGRPLPSFNAVDLTGEAIGSYSITGQLTALLFVGADCSTCEMTLDDLAALHTKAEQNLVVICQGERDECGQLAERYSIASPVISDRAHEISDLFEVTTVPTAVIVGANGRIASVGNPLGSDDLEKLIAEAPEEEQEEPELVLHQQPARDEEEVAT